MVHSPADADADDADDCVYTQRMQGASGVCSHPAAPCAIQKSVPPSRHSVWLHVPNTADHADDWDVRTLDDSLLELTALGGELMRLLEITAARLLDCTKATGELDGAALEERELEREDDMRDDERRDDLEELTDELRDELAGDDDGEDDAGVSGHIFDAQKIYCWPPPH